MKKMLKNQKGFSLVELLIVIAIMGVIAAVAFGMFAGVLGNSKRRADERTADQIAKAVTAYMTDSGEKDLSKLIAAGALADVAASNDVEKVIAALQIKNGVLVGDSYYGSYLTPKKGDDAKYANFAPQCEQHEGYEITIYPSLLKADAKPVVKGKGTVRIVNGEPASGSGS